MVSPQCQFTDDNQSISDMCGIWICVFSYAIWDYCIGMMFHNHFICTTLNTVSLVWTIISRLKKEFVIFFITLAVWLYAFLYNVQPNNINIPLRVWEVHQYVRWYDFLSSFFLRETIFTPAASIWLLSTVRQHILIKTLIYIYHLLTLLVFIWFQSRVSICTTSSLACHAKYWPKERLDTQFTTMQNIISLFAGHNIIFGIFVWRL